MIKITSKRDGFRRCGVAHNLKPTEYSDKTFSKKDLAILQAEPMLIVEVIEEVAEGNSQTAGKGKK